MKIGLRIPGTARQMPFADFCKWCVDNGFEAIDIGEVTPEVVKTARDAGLEIGSADLPGTRELLSAKKSTQKSGAQKAKAAIEAAADNDVHIMFCVFVPEDASLGRAKNFDIFNSSFILLYAITFLIEFARSLVPFSKQDMILPINSLLFILNAS